MKLNKEMTFADILNACPNCGEILLKYGLHCIGCHLSTMESLQDGCKAHGIADEDVNKMVKELNKKLEE